MPRNYGLLVCFCQLHEITVKYAVCGQLSGMKLAIHLTPQQREVRNGVFESWLQHDCVHLWELCTYMKCRVAKVELYSIKNSISKHFQYLFLKQKLCNCLAILMKLKFKVYCISGWMGWQSREVWVGVYCLRTLALFKNHLFHYPAEDKSPFFTAYTRT